LLRVNRKISGGRLHPFLEPAALALMSPVFETQLRSSQGFAPIAVFATSPNLLLVHPSFPAKNVREFIAVAKKPRQTQFSSSGGSTWHLSGEMLKLMITAST
jgi:tripartite-type tricarboxylate transporter receptor subunit TctC